MDIEANLKANIFTQKCLHRFQLDDVSLTV